MSVARRIMHWLALRLRPAEAGPDARDLNLQLPSEPGPEAAAQPEPDAAQQRRYRHACWRAGPWQQK